MSKSERPGYATLTLEVPIEVAEWLATYGEHLAQIAALAANKARFNSEVAKQERKWNSEARQAELHNLGRAGYRLFRHYGGGNNIAKRPELIQRIALELQVDGQALEISVRNFKRMIKAKALVRRGREITRMYLGGCTNKEIATRLNIHKNTVSNYLSEHKTEIKAYAREHPESYKPLKNNNKGKVPGKSLGASEPVPWEAIKSAGRRA